MKKDATATLVELTQKQFFGHLKTVKKNVLEQGIKCEKGWKPPFDVSLDEQGIYGEMPEGEGPSVPGFLELLKDLS